MTLPQTVHIRDMRDETHTIRTFVLDAEVPEADPGQFVMLWLPGVDGKPISIAHPAPLTVTVARVGPFGDQGEMLPPATPSGTRAESLKTSSLRQTEQ